MRTLIVVPCYNEVGRFQPAAFDEYLAKSSDVGFVLVNDGSRDGTLDMLKTLESRWGSRVHVIDQQPNRGKAEAVRVGMLRAQSSAEYVGYFDADLATPLDAIVEFVEVLDAHAKIDIVLGARVALLGRAIHREARRHYLGRVFATAASLVLAIPVYDTQCGAKLFRARPTLIPRLFGQPFGSRWIFDVEIFARYLMSVGNGDGLYELPLRQWTDVGESRVKPSDFLRAGGEMAAIYRNYGLRRDFDAVLGFMSSPFVRYAAAGVAGTLVQYGTLVAVVELFRLSPTLGTLVGATAGAVVNYTLNYYLTFASKVAHWRTAPRYFAIAAILAGLSAIGMQVLTGLHVYYLFAQLVCTVFALIVGYVLNRLWTFRASAEAVPPPSLPRALEAVTPRERLSRPPNSLR